MPLLPTQPNYLSRVCTVALLAVSFVAESLAQDLSRRDKILPAIAAVTSHTGNILHRDHEGNKRTVHTRAILPINQTSFKTAPKGSLFLSLSNGVGLGLGESTSINILEYRQAAINPLHEGLHYESSESNLRIQLTVGEFAVAFNHLSPLSKAKIDLPLGHLIIHSGQVLLSTLPDATSTISVFKGTATYYSHSGNDREFISAGTCLTVTPSSAILAQIPDASSPEIYRESQRLTAAAEHSRLRVLFRHNPAGGLPLLEWILPEEYFGRPSARPYQFDLK